MDVKFYRNKRKISGLVIQAKNHTVTLGMFLLFVAGCVVGSILMRSDSAVTDLVVSMFKKYNSLIVSSGYFKNLLDLLAGNTFILFILFFLGLSAVGAPLICFVPLIKGIGIGIVSSYIYKTYQLSGFGYCMLVFYPQQIINMFALFIALNESYVNSRNIYMVFRNNIQESFDIKIYSIRFAVSALVIIISCVLGALLNTYLSGVFIK